MTKAVSYLRTSSASNVGGDSDTRQRDAIEAYARANGIEIVAEFYDAAVSGSDMVTDRPGFIAMLDKIDSNGVRMVLVEDASRFARKLMVQEAGLALMEARGVRVLTSTGDDMTDSDDETRVMIRQVMGAMVQFERARVVSKLKGARDRASAAAGHRVEGRKGATEKSIVLDAIRSIRAKDPDVTFAGIADQLAARGIVTANGGTMDRAQVFRICKANGV